MAFTGFTAWFEKRSEPHLAEAVVDFLREDKLGGQLTIKAPNARVPKVDENSPLRIESITSCTTKLTRPWWPTGAWCPSSRSWTEKRCCNSCAARAVRRVDMTLKQGVEKTLLSQLPELKGVRDSTDHSVKEKRILLSLRVREEAPARVSF